MGTRVGPPTSPFGYRLALLAKIKPTTVKGSMALDVFFSVRGAFGLLVGLRDDSPVQAAVSALLLVMTVAMFGAGLWALRAAKRLPPLEELAAAAAPAPPPPPPPFPPDTTK